ncbi:AAA family ATPase [archaeon]|nr:AAA family ATPase [archaeon]
MIIKGLKLENIRSYSSSEIKFPSGNILLSGNIGSGKTSLLLAIDFVLFGLRRGALSGASLLRHGEDKGSVELNFEIDGQNVIIKRTLKRGSKGVGQDFGFINVDGDMFEGTAIQLKQKVLELFNYPAEFLTKSKSLIYNYTVYTPQEEMKSILLADSKERLIILRKVFGIDKYQRIVDNSKILLNVLKNKKKEMEIRISNLVDKINERDEKRARVTQLKAELEVLDGKLSEVSKGINEAKKQIELIEEEKGERDNLLKEFEIVSNNITNLIDSRLRNNKTVENLQVEINSLEKEVKSEESFNLDVLNKRILDKEEDIRRQDVELKEILKKIYKSELRINEADKNKEGIFEMMYCPYCKQNVSEEHKHKIVELENIKIKENKEVLDGVKSREKVLEGLILEIKKEVEQLKKQKSAYELYKFKRESLDHKYTQLDELLLEQKSLKGRIGELNVKKSEISLKLEAIPDVQEKYLRIKQELDEFLRGERVVVSNKAGFENEFKMLNEFIERLGLEILEGEEIKGKILEYSKLISWFERDFVNLVQIMEKQIMMKVHSDFDNLFKDWFRILVSDENLKIRLDSDFTPLIEQNGYDTDYLHLSGGEKTSAALAYRLALNQVINTVMSDINTKDLLILDEPTDGFSSEQVDKIRLILEELGVKQVIIVSHDAKIESFVDTVIRFEKVEGLSKVL